MACLSAVIIVASVTRYEILRNPNKKEPCQSFLQSGTQLKLQALGTRFAAKSSSLPMKTSEMSAILCERTKRNADFKQSSNVLFPRNVRAAFS